eukprot:PhF_6_TR7925/c0_g1_i1/m.11860
MSAFRLFGSIAVMFVLFSCHVDASLYLDGKSYYETQPFSFPTTGTTIEFWIRFDSITNAKQDLVCIGVNTPVVNDMLCASVDQKVWVIENTNDTVSKPTTTTVTAFTWMHIAFTVTKTAYSFVVDSTEISTGDVGQATFSTPVKFRIGTCFGNDGKHVLLKGALDTVRVWNGAQKTTDVIRNAGKLVRDDANFLSIQNGYTETLFPNPSCKVTTPATFGSLKDATTVLFQGNPPAIQATKAWLTFDKSMELKNTIASSPILTLCTLNPVAGVQNGSTVTPWVTGKESTQAFAPIPARVPPAAQASLLLDGDGTKNRVSFKGFTLPATYSLEMWIYPTSKKRGSLIATLSSSFQFSPLSLWYTSGGTTETFDLDTDIPTNEWTHLAFQYNDKAGTMRFVMNGKLMETKTKISAWIGEDVEIGSQPESDKFVFTGMLDELRVYNYIRSVDEILSTKGLKLSEPFPAQLVHYVSFNEGKGASLLDSASKTSGVIANAFSPFSPLTPLTASAMAQFAITCPGNGYMPDSNAVTTFTVSYPGTMNLTAGVIFQRKDLFGNGVVVRHTAALQVVVEIWSGGSSTLVTSGVNTISVDSWTDITLVTSSVCPTKKQTTLYFGDKVVGSADVAPGTPDVSTNVILGSTTVGVDGTIASIEDFTISTLYGTPYYTVLDATPSPPTLLPAPVVSTVPRIFGVSGCPQKSPTSSFSSACKLDPTNIALTIVGNAFGTRTCDNSTSGASCVVFTTVGSTKIPAPYCTNTIWTDTKIICPAGNFVYPTGTVVPDTTKFVLSLRTTNGTALMAQEFSLRHGAEVPIVRGVVGCSQGDDSDKKAFGCFTGTELTISGSLFAVSNKSAGLLNNVTFTDPTGDGNVSKKLLTCDVTQSTYTSLVCVLAGIESAMLEFDPPYRVVVSVGGVKSKNTDVTISPIVGKPTVETITGCDGDIGQTLVYGCDTGASLTIQGKNFGTLPDFSDPDLHQVLLTALPGSVGTPLCPVQFWEDTEIVCTFTMNGAAGEWSVGVISYGETTLSQVYLTSKYNPLSLSVVPALIPDSFTSSEGTASDGGGTLGSSTVWRGQKADSWLQVDLLQTYTVYHFATSSLRGSTTLSVKLSYGNNKNSPFTEIGSSFQLNRQGDITVVTLTPPITARYFRFTVDTFEGTPSLNVDLYANVPMTTCADWKSRNTNVTDGMYLLAVPNSIMAFCRMDFFDHAWTMFHTQVDDSVVIQRRYAAAGYTSRLSPANVAALALASSAVMIDSPTLVPKGVFTPTSIQQDSFILSLGNSSATTRLSRAECLSTGIQIREWYGPKATSDILLGGSASCTPSNTLFQSGTLLVRYNNYSTWTSPISVAFSTPMEAFVGAPLRSRGSYKFLKLKVLLSFIDVEGFRAELSSMAGFSDPKMLVYVGYVPENGITWIYIGVNAVVRNPEATVQLMTSKAHDDPTIYQNLRVQTVQIMKDMSTEDGPPVPVVGMEDLSLFERLGWISWLIVAVVCFGVLVILVIIVRTRCCGKCGKGGSSGSGKSRGVDDTPSDSVPGGNAYSPREEMTSVGATTATTTTATAGAGGAGGATTTTTTAEGAKPVEAKPAYPRRIRDAQVPEPWQCFEVESGERYYYNPVTKSTTWDIPTA